MTFDKKDSMHVFYARLFACSVLCPRVRRFRVEFIVILIINCVTLFFVWSWFLKTKRIVACTRRENTQSMADSFLLKSLSFLLILSENLKYFSDINSFFSENSLLFLMKFSDTNIFFGWNFIVFSDGTIHFSDRTICFSDMTILFGDGHFLTEPFFFLMGASLFLTKKLFAIKKLRLCVFTDERILPFHAPWEPTFPASPCQKRTSCLEIRCQAPHRTHQQFSTSVRSALWGRWNFDFFQTPKICTQKSFFSVWNSKPIERQMDAEKVNLDQRANKKT